MVADDAPIAGRSSAVRRISTWIVILGLMLVISVANHNILKKEQVLDSGRQVLLELRPVDPRSLIQGDYMRLAYAEKAFPAAGVIDSMPYKGTIVLAIGDDGVAVFSRIDDGSPLAQNEQRLQYKRFVRRWGTTGLRIGAESFLFQEGQAELYADAKYGVLRVDEAGGSVLVGLADEARRVITAP
jgi:uncharacterized membrane-anchored protein